MSVTRREPMPGSVYKSKKFEAAISKLRKKKAARESRELQPPSSPRSPRNPRRSRKGQESVEINESPGAKSQSDQPAAPDPPPSPCASCASSCSCEDRSDGSEINDITRNSNNSNQNTPVAGIRSSVKVSDAARRRKGEEEDRREERHLVKRMRREEERQEGRGEPRQRDRVDDGGGEGGKGLRRQRGDDQHRTNDQGDQGGAQDEEEAGRRAERGHHHQLRHQDHRLRRQEKTARLLRKDYPSLLKYFLKDCIFFIMKSSNYENIQISMDQGVWSTPPQNEQRLSKAFAAHRNVLLVFSAKESGRFAGFARLSSPLLPDHPAVKWILPASLAGKRAFNGVFQVDWISRRELPFALTSHLFNPLNDGKPVKIARDGQEIDGRVGEELVNLFPRDEEIQIIPLLKRMKKQALNRIKQLAGMRHQQGQQEPDDQSLPHAADCRSLPRRLTVVLHNNLHSPADAVRDRERGRRRVQMPATTSQGYGSSRSRPDARDRLDFSRRVAVFDEDNAGRGSRYKHSRERYRYD